MKIKVELIDYMPKDKTLLNKILNQSRSYEPKNIDGLFLKSIEWGHNSIQEFVVFIFRFEGLSRVAIAQLTRHRIASYLIMSSRHTISKEVVLPKGIKSFNGEIILENNKKIEYHIDNNGNFNLINKDIINKIENSPSSMENIRYLFPEGVCLNGYFLMNGRSLRNFLRLRLSKEAQWEIREFAKKIYDLVNNIFPEILYKL